MKILFVTFYFYPKHYGGVETYIFDLARHFQKSGHAVRIFCVEPESDTDMNHETALIEESYDGIAVDRLIRYRFRFITHPTLKKIGYDYIDKIKPDVIHFFSGWGVSLFSDTAMSLCVPTVYTITDFSLACLFTCLLIPASPYLSKRDRGNFLCSGPGSLKCRLCAIQKGATVFFEKITFGGTPVNKGRFTIKADITDYIKGLAGIPKRIEDARGYSKRLSLLIAPCDNTRDIYIENGFGNEKILISIQGIQAGNLNFEEKKNIKDVNFAFIGRFDHIKGLHILIEAFNSVSLKCGDAKLYIYGDFQHAIYKRYNSKLARLINSNARIIWPGKISQTELDRVYRDIDVLVVPSLWCENSPITILEALSRKRPVIASDVPGMNFLIKDGENGLLFRRGDAKDLADKMLAVANDPSILNNLSDNIKAVKSVEDNAEELLGYYKGLKDGIGRLSG